MHKISDFHLITCDHPEKDLITLVQKAVNSNINWLQLRLKNGSDKEILENAGRVKEICDLKGVRLIINDHVHIARTINAYGVHLGKKDMEPSEARKILGPSKVIGGTANTIEDVLRLTEAKVDYIGAGPFRFTSTKKDLSPVLGGDGIEKLCDATQLPVIAIGGISADDVDDLLRTGIHGVAVASAVFHKEDIAAEVKRFRNKLNKSNT